ncbi:MAG TPA: hypothetical protein VHM88_08270 [Candidatus Acidoferrales bacterium]|nr:hypothetical protein [Candidatus Acidoferrales bacterium]
MIRCRLRYFGLAIILLIIAVDVAHGLVRIARADTLTNTDAFESGASVASPWWSSYGSLTVTQRYGCTVDPIAAAYEDPAPECPAPYPAGDARNNRWHQGIDIDTRGGSINLSSATEGTVADFFNPQCLTCGTLGYLGIRTLGGSIVYLLHGIPTGSFQSIGVNVHVGDAVYVTGSNGGSTGYHLHFEVHKSAIGQLAQHPGDDINPETWLVPGLTAQSAMGAMAVTDISGNEAFYAFAPRPVDGHLSLNFYSTSSGWIWLDESSPSVSANPPPVALSGRVGQISFMDSGGVLRQYAFVAGVNGHLYTDFYSTTGWRWTDQSVLSGAPARVRDVVGTGTFIDNTGARDLYAFVLDSAGALWVNYGSFATGNPQNWSNLSARVSPSLPALSAGIGSAAGLNAATGFHALYAFAEGTDGHLYLLSGMKEPKARGLGSINTWIRLLLA